MGNVRTQGLLQPLEGPELKIRINSKGEWTLTETKRETLDKALPILKTPMNTRHSEYNWLRQDDISANLEGGEILAITVRYTGKIEDEENPDSPSFPKTQLRISTSDEPLLSHSRYDEVSEQEKLVLAKIISGSTEDGLDDEISSDLGLEALAKIRKGTTAFRDPKVEFIRSYTTNEPLADLNDVGDIADDPEDAPSIAANRNWLFVGANQDHENSTYDIQLIWELSGRGGWDEDLYSPDP